MALVGAFSVIVKLQTSQRFVSSSKAAALIFIAVSALCLLPFQHHPVDEFSGIK